MFLLVCVSVFMSSLAQIALKAGLNRPEVSDALRSESTAAFARSVISNPMVWAGLGIYAASTAVWMLVLARIEVSLAYPFVGLGFIITMLLGWQVHGESLSPNRVIGTLLIVAGVAVLSRN